METEESTKTSTRVGQATGATREQATQVAGTAKEQAQEVAQQAKQQAKSTVRQLQDDARERADQEASKLAETMRSASRQMRSMASCADGEQQSLATNLMHEGAQAADRFASQLDEGGIERVTADVRSWARRNPGGFLLGAAFAGFVVGRIARNLSGTNDDSGHAVASGPDGFSDALENGRPSTLGLAGQNYAPPTGIGALE